MNGLRAGPIGCTGCRHGPWGRAWYGDRSWVRSGPGAGRASNPSLSDPIGAPTWETSLQLLAPRGCLINYGELSGPVPDINLHALFPGSIFVTKFNGDAGSKGSRNSPFSLAKGWP